MDEREMFEAWADLDGLSIRRCTHLDDIYASPATRVAWRAWQVGRRTTPDREAWISVDERLPEPDEPVLAHNGKWMGVAAWMSGEYLEPIERWQDEHREFIELLGPAVTHWMPLPTAPTSDKGGA
ncbi:DUF551 domain-containing protein [Burkholderia cenocepacia]|uniref:DUF551 domain-containing protein n=1 Tax=Burkholderia cenocepacia TaxID=95486 RepID=UPI000759B014|nr:DUF551 domain-containing protein [Burkholderia cenocepacia]AOK33930.1 hypothetical protein WL90_06490 [Burkholderia cenocepacia]KWF74568.1 hypothetical protein WL89_30925 [Burkholderia cenocepacia]